MLRNLDSFVIEVDPSRTTLCSAHYFDERGGLVAQGWYEGGTRFLDVTNPADIKQVGYWIPAQERDLGRLLRADRSDRPDRLLARHDARRRRDQDRPRQAPTPARLRRAAAPAAAAGPQAAAAARRPTSG